MSSRVVLHPVVPLDRAPEPLRAPLRSAAFVGLTACAFGLARAHQGLVPAADRSRVFAGHQKRWFRALLDVFGVHVRLAGDPSGSEGRARLVVANHRSALDVAVLGWLFGGSLLSRGDLRGWPGLGAVAKAAGTIFVDREDARSGAAAVRAIRERLEGAGSVSLFPEGTTFEDDVVRPFRRGSFSAAARTGCIVVPVGLAYDATGHALFRQESFLGHLRHVARAPAIHVAVRVGEPIAASPEVGPEALSVLAHESVQALTLQAREDCDRGVHE